jgi:hypothetical protein
VKQCGEAIVSQERETLEKRYRLNQDYRDRELELLREAGRISVEEQKRQELALLSAMRNHTKQDGTADPLITEEAYEAGKAAITSKYEEMKLRIREQYGIARMDELYEMELSELESKHAQELLSEKDFEQAKFNLKLKYAEKYVKKAEEFIQAGSNAVNSIEEAETAKLDAEYTKRQSALTEQYNKGIISQEKYNEEKEKLDYEQKTKELEIQKKYADVNFAMQVAQIIATTAQGIITAWSTSMTLSPIAGPIAAAAMTALLAITSGAQISKAKAERDRVKAMTLEGLPAAGAVPVPKPARYS